MNKYINGELIRVEPGSEGSPVAHVVWDSYAQREVRIYPRPKAWLVEWSELEGDRHLTFQNPQDSEGAYDGACITPLYAV